MKKEDLKGYELFTWQLFWIKCHPGLICMSINRSCVRGKGGICEYLSGGTLQVNCRLWTDPCDQMLNETENKKTEKGNINVFYCKKNNQKRTAKGIFA